MHKFSTVKSRQRVIDLQDLLGNQPFSTQQIADHYKISFSSAKMHIEYLMIFGGIKAMEISGKKGMHYRCISPKVITFGSRVRKSDMEFVPPRRQYIFFSNIPAKEEFVPRRDPLVAAFFGGRK